MRYSKPWNILEGVLESSRSMKSVRKFKEFKKYENTKSSMNLKETSEQMTAKKVIQVFPSSGLRDLKNRNTAMKDYQMQLVTDYMGFADEVATKIGSMALQTRDEMCVTLDDLKQESWLGLYEAAKNYDKALGIDFKLLAYMWCRKHVVDALSQYSAPLSGPEKGKRGIDILHFDVLGRDLGDDEDGSPADYLFYQLALMAEAEERAAEADEKAKRRVKRRVKRALRGLTQREREVICHLFGLGGKPLTRNETASLMGVTNERIRILQEKALNRLELYLAA